MTDSNGLKSIEETDSWKNYFTILPFMKNHVINDSARERSRSEHWFYVRECCVRSFQYPIPKPVNHFYWRSDKPLNDRRNWLALFQNTKYIIRLQGNRRAFGLRLQSQSLKSRVSGHPSSGLRLQRTHVRVDPNIAFSRRIQKRNKINILLAFKEVGTDLF